MPVQVDVLAGVELFRGLPGAALERLAALAEPGPVASGTALFRLGDPAERLYAIARGRVALSLPIEVRGAQEELTVDEKGPGEIVGWSALVPPHRSTLSARALIDSELLVFAGGPLLEVLGREPDLGFRVMANLGAVIGRRLHQSQAMWLRELQRSVQARYA